MAPYNGSGDYVAPSNSWNPAVGGTTVDSADWNSTQQDYETALSQVITKDGQTTITANLPMSGFKHTGVNPNSGSTSRTEYASGATLQDNVTQDAGVTAGSSTVYTATLAPAIAAYVDKACYRVQFDEACGATPTINFNGVGAKKLYKNVAGTATQLAANDVPANFIGILRYDTALDTAAGGFWLINNAGLAPGSVTSAMLADQTYIDFTEGAAPATPAASTVVIYAKTDGLMYSKDDAGVETQMSLPVATQAEMETATSVITAVSPGRQQYHPGHPKAWANFNAGTGAITADYGITSVTDNTTGNFSPQFDVAMSSANYAVVANGPLVGTGGGADGGSAVPRDLATGSVRIVTFNTTNGNLQDNAAAHIVVFGDQ